ncbi:hypothetical protein CK203_029622 [Vitis vinifera]|uniref:Uncharacterized protein n=1 Tax=Vitis vinifera TaxID=29760 RepID=A0A438IIB3_VITVI|nr:hypothetical protein CK203_029622 [Vitis vinifera]
MATPSRSRSSGRGEEDNSEWRQAIEKKTVGKRTTTESSPPGDRKIKRENAVLRIQASTSGSPRRQRSRGQVANSRPGPESIYPGQQELSQKHVT